MLRASCKRRYFSVGLSRIVIRSFEDATTDVLLPRSGVAMKAPLPLQQDQKIQCSAERKKLVDSCSSVASKELFYWKYFHLSLPHSSFIDGRDETLEKGGQIIRNPFNLEQDLQIDSPTANQKLSTQQLEDVKQTGTFVNVDNAGKEHTWRVTSLLVSGEQKYKDTLSAALKQSYRFLYNIPYYLKNPKDTFSIPRALEDLKKIPKELTALIIGIPESKMPYNTTIRLREHRTEHLFKEFLPQIHRWKKTLEVDEKKPNNGSVDTNTRVSNLIITSDVDGKPVQLDLRFWDDVIHKSVSQKLNEIITNTRTNWDENVLSFVRNLLADQNFNDPEEFERIQNFLIEQTRKECTNRLLNDITDAKNTLESVGGTGVVPLLRALVQTNETLYSVNESCRKEHDLIRDEMKQKIIEDNPYQGTIDEWVEEEIERQERIRFQIPSNESVKNFLLIQKYEKAITKLEELAVSTPDPEEKKIIEQHLFLARRAFHWINNEKEKISEEMKKDAEPYTLKYANTIILKRNMPVVYNKDTGKYQLHRETFTTVKTDHWGWRWDSFMARSKSCFTFIAFIAHENFFSSPFSYRALLPARAAASDVFDPQTGKFKSSKDSFPTMISQVKNIFQSIKMSREKFENETDAGFLGKDISRIFNISWNYLFKGAIGSILVVSLYPPLVVFSSAISVLLAASSFVLAPVAAVCKTIFDWFIADSDGYGKNFTSPVGFPLPMILGVRTGSFLVRSGVALGVSLILSPIAALTVISLASSYVSIGRLYDSFMYQTIVKPFGRVPQSNSFVVRRIAGPGLSIHHAYTIGAEEALTILQLELEKEALAHYVKITEKQILIPQHTFNEFAEQVFGQFGGFTCRNNVLEASTRMHSNELSSLARKRIAELPKLGDIEPLLHKVRMNFSELRRTLERAEEQVKQFVEEKIFRDQFQSSPILTREYWAEKRLPEGDWKNLTITNLTNRFSSDFFVPLTEEDETMRLEIVPSGQIDNFLSMIALDDPHDDLDRANVNFQIIPQFPLDNTLRQAYFFPYHDSLPLLDECFAPFPKPRDISFNNNKTK